MKFMQAKYECIKCGLCCRNLEKNNIYEDLHSGDGVCKYLNTKTNLCTIYEKRPILCNVDLSYEKYFSKEYTLKEYYKLNYKGCRNLWEMRKKEKMKRKKL